MPHGAAPRPGARVHIGNCKATVRYVGEVRGQTGPWVGLEWDDAARGKNDGSTGGQAYFSCRSPSAGSFLRLDKYNSQAELGCTVLEALQRRYGDQDFNADQAAEPAEQVSKAEGRKGVEWQFIGADKVHAKISQIQSLDKATLINCCISSVGSKQEVRESLPQLQELDLSENLLSSWLVLQQLGTALPSLACVNLTHNLMAMPTPEELRGAPHNQSLRILVLNKCCLSWSQVVLIQESVPSLQELHLCSNGISQLSASSSGGRQFSQLQLLDLEDNNISDWAEVMHLSHLPCLQHLWLGGNQLQHINLQPGSTAFQHLQTTLLRDNILSSWGDVDSLNRLISLTDLRLSGNPILNDARGGGRYEVVARVQGLTMLNGSAVRHRERRDCELRYLRAVLGELDEVKADPQAAAALKASHPRLDALQDQYGPMAGAIAPASTGTALSSSMVEVHLVCVAPSAGKKMGRQTKKVPGSLEVGKLKLLCQRLFKVPAARQALFLKAGGENPMPDNIGEDDSKDLMFFSIENGAEILVDDFDPEAHAKQTLVQKAEDARHHAARMLRQTKAIDVIQSVQKQQHAESLASIQKADNQ
ncbi:hypothetical protein WJX82_006869 [Trebouxia sp. C0006]